MRLAYWLLRPIAYLWALPTSCVGLALTVPALLSGGRARVHSGVLEVSGGFAAWALRYLTLLPGGADAITFGHVVLARTDWLLDATRTHERVHVRQAEWFGPLFLPAYGVASLIALVCRRNPYRDNWFEKRAYALDPPLPTKRRRGGGGSGGSGKSSRGPRPKR